MFRQLWTKQPKHLVENLLLSGGMRAFLNKHPVESVYGKLESGNFSRALVDLIAGTYGNKSKIDLKVGELMSLPSIEKENYATMYMIVTQDCNGDFVYINSTSCWKETMFCWHRKSHGMMAKEMAVEGAINSFKLLMYLPLTSKNLEERTIRKASLLVCESVLIGLFGTRPGGAYSNCPFVTYYKRGNLQWPLHDGRWVREANWLKREGQMLRALHDYWVANEETRLDRCKSRRSQLKRRATAGTEGERRALGFPVPTENQVEARQAKEGQYRANWTPEYKALVKERKCKQRASLNKEQAADKQKTEAGRKRRAKMTEEQKAEKRRQRNTSLRNKKADMDNKQRERNRI
ncbi:hypothetical protein MMC30_005940 [Trapelia coarctata]|nr:hypothetical protein [Trapelia coarctata]